MASKAQLKKIRKKYGLGEFKKSRKVYKVRRSRIRMAKRKRRTSRKMFGKSSSGIWTTVFGALGYVAFENYIEPKIPLQEPLLSASEMAVGLWLSRKGGFVGGLGRAAVIINAYQLSKFYLGNTMGGQQVTSMFAY